MRYIDFLAQFKEKQVISIQDIRNIFGKVNHAQLLGWQKKGLLKKAKSGHFVLADSLIDAHVLANELNYSYVSLEYALSYYQMIPDIAQVVTSVSKDRNEKIQNIFGDFSYRKIRGELFAGFVLSESPILKKRFFRIATPEKAIFDLVYFRTDLKNENDFKSLRLHPPEKFSIKKVARFASLVAADQIKKRLDNLIKYLYAVV
jgi:predicted transcriptional regulator of viral defense system